MRFFCFLFFAFISSISFAQPEKNLNNQDKYDYMLGLSYVTSGYVLQKDYANPFQNTGTSARLFFDQLLYDTWSVEGSLSYESTVLYPDKSSDTTYRYDSLSRFTLDFASKFSTARLIGSNVFDPYFLFGGGATYHKTIGVNANAGLGLNIWLTRNFGVQAQSMIKLPLSKNIIGRTYLQSNVGIVIRFSKPAIPSGSFNKKRYRISKKRKRIKVPKNKNKQS